MPPLSASRLPRNECPIIIASYHARRRSGDVRRRLAAKVVGALSSLAVVSVDEAAAATSDSQGRVLIHARLTAACDMSPFPGSGRVRTMARQRIYRPTGACNRCARRACASPGGTMFQSLCGALLLSCCTPAWPWDAMSAEMTRTWSICHCHRTRVLYISSHFWISPYLPFSYLYCGLTPGPPVAAPVSINKPLNRGKDRSLKH